MEHGFVSTKDINLSVSVWFTYIRMYQTKHNNKNHQIFIKSRNLSSVSRSILLVFVIFPIRYGFVLS